MLAVKEAGLFMDYAAIFGEAEALVSGPGSPAQRLQALCDLLKAKIPHYDWFGFYVAEAGKPELFLGPFAGEPTEHTRIAFGKGICGQAAATKEVFLVPDVSAADNYLACSLKVKSEIVVPVFAPGGFDYDKGRGAGEVVGEIDIDSHTKDAFTEEDRDFLDSLAILVAQDVAALRQ